MKKIVLLGATGSIGTQTIDVIKKHPDLFELVAISVGKNIALLKDILNTIDIKYICTTEKHPELSLAYPNSVFYDGEAGLKKLASLNNYDLLINALVGFVGLKPTMLAIANHKDIALANKESLVVAGKFIREARFKSGVKIFPLDSEHSAIFQALQGNDIKEVNKLIITASGGSFRDKTRAELTNVTLNDALKHPNWLMGAKITIDSATMMNKGFEVIEAHWLFDIAYDDIEVVLHKQSIVHSMVEYKDFSIIAQMGNADMRIPIQYALSYPNRLRLQGTKPLSFKDCLQLDFEPIDFERFPLLKLAYEVGKKDGNLPAIMNAANEIANEAFREGKISFLDIEKYIFEAVNAADYISNASIQEVYQANTWARKYVSDLIIKNNS